MANLKFSQFTAYATTPVTSTSGLVAYEGSDNIQFTPTQLAPLTGIYAADGTVATGRKALLAGTLQFRNAGDTSDIFSLNTNGTFALGLDAANTSETNVCIGIEAATSSVYGVAIGRKVTMSAPASYATVIGNQASATGSQSVIVGAYSIAGTYGVTIGASSGGAGAYSLNLGRQATGSAANAVTINASGAAAAPSTQYAFGVYMTSETTPDLEVVGAGMSTLNTNLTIKGTDDLIGTTGLLVENNSGDDLFFIKNDGTFALGNGATSLSNTNVVIGRDAKDSQATNIESVVIGYSAEVYNALNQDDCVTVGAHSSVRHEGVAIGSASNHYGVKGVSIGYQSSVADNGISIGNLSGVIGGTTANVINIGYYSASSGANSIVINSSGSQANPSTANAFGVYMTSNTSADFEVVGGGESTLNTSFKITGQAYTELHTGTTPVDPNWNNGNIQESTLVAGSSDFDPTNPKAGATYILKLTQPATANGTVNWDNIGAANIKWPGGTEPTLTASAAAVDIITLICTDATGQGVYYASATLNMQ